MWWKVDFTQQPAIPAQWLDQEEAPKHFSKPNLHQKKITVTIWWSATRLTHYSFLNPSKTISSEKYAQQINEMHWKLQHLQLALVIRKDSILLTPCTTKASKVEGIGVWSFALSALFIQPLTDWLPLLEATQQLFSGKMLPQPAGCRKYFLRVYWIPKQGFLCYRNKYTFLIGKNLLIVMVPILLNKDVFEPSYKDLKFRVQNHNYLCTKLTKRCLLLGRKAMTNLENVLKSRHITLPTNVHIVKAMVFPVAM